MQNGAVRFGPVLALVLLISQGGCAASGGVRSLTLAHPLRAGETAYLEVRLGALPTGQEIELRSDTGRMLGVISPHAIRPGRDAGTYTVPLPNEVIRDGRIRIQLVTTPAGGAARDATEDEVRSVRVVVNKATGR